MHLLGRTSIDGSGNATVELEFLRSLCSWIIDLSTRISTPRGLPVAAADRDQVLVQAFISGVQRV